MYSSHSDIHSPPDDTLIWRYVSMEKLLALFATRKLFLSRMDSFADPWEGVWPKAFIDALNVGASPTTVAEFLPTLDGLRTSFYVSCWHGSPHESAALWDQYSGVAGFAIKSSIGLLKKSLNWDQTFYIGSVKYMDYDNFPFGPGFINALKPPFMKRKSFEHEREVRVLHWKPENIEASKGEGFDALVPDCQIDVNLEVLIAELLISPTAPKWLDQHVKCFLEAFGLEDVSVKRSTLYDPYIY